VRDLPLLRMSIKPGSRFGRPSNERRGNIIMHGRSSKKTVLQKSKGRVRDGGKKGGGDFQSLFFPLGDGRQEKEEREGKKGAQHRLEEKSYGRRGKGLFKKNTPGKKKKSQGYEIICLRNWQHGSKRGGQQRPELEQDKATKQLQTTIRRKLEGFFLNQEKHPKFKTGGVFKKIVTCRSKIQKRADCDDCGARGGRGR